SSPTPSSPGTAAARAADLRRRAARVCLWRRSTGRHTHRSIGTANTRKRGPMAAVAVALLTRPPNRPAEQELPELDDTLPELDPNTFEIVTDTDKLVVACSCSSSSDNPYQ